MLLHSQDNQCNPWGASEIIIFKGESYGATEGVLKFFVDQYLKAWDKRRQEIFRDLRDNIKYYEKEIKNGIDFNLELEETKYTYERLKRWKSETWEEYEMRHEKLNEKYYLKEEEKENEQERGEVSILQWNNMSGEVNRQDK